jgi:cytochrome c biogenesis protein CcmG, thiol:disulfide interchange protein DsbE
MPVSRRLYSFASILLLLLGLGWIYLSRTSPRNASAQDLPAAQKGFLAPDFELKTLDGQSIRLSDLRGKGVILNLWASWCGPCKEEMPAIQKVYEAYQQKGLVVLAVNQTLMDDRQSVEMFSAQYRLTFPVLLDEDGKVGQAYHVQALPSSYFIGPDGIIQDAIVGGPIPEAVFQTQAEALLKGVR